MDVGKPEARAARAEVYLTVSGVRTRKVEDWERRRLAGSNGK